MSTTVDRYGIPKDSRGFPVRQPTVDEVVEYSAKVAHPVFVAHGWVYGGSWTVPTEGELQDTIRRLLRNMREDAEAMETASGRFLVTRNWFGLQVCLELGCVDESQNSEPHPSDSSVKTNVDNPENKE